MAQTSATKEPSTREAWTLVLVSFALSRPGTGVALTTLFTTLAVGGLKAVSYQLSASSRGDLEIRPRRSAALLLGRGYSLRALAVYLQTEMLTS